MLRDVSRRHVTLKSVVLVCNKSRNKADAAVLKLYAHHAVLFRTNTRVEHMCRVQSWLLILCLLSPYALFPSVS